MNNVETSEQQSNPSDLSTPSLDEKQIEGELLQHPEMLERLLNKPEFQAVVRKEVFSGPLPPPKVLAGYDKIVDGAAERILAMAEKEQNHRHGMDRSAIEGEISKDKRGQRYGFAIAIFFGIAALILGLTGQPWLGGILGTVDLVALVTVFVLGHSREE